MRGGVWRCILDHTADARTIKINHVNCRNVGMFELPEKEHPLRCLFDYVGRVMDPF